MPTPAALRPAAIPITGLFPGRGGEYVHPAASRGARRSCGSRFPSDIPNLVQARSPATLDLDLVAAMARAEEWAASELYDRHAPVMYGLALRMTGESADAEEVVLDAFSQAWRDAARYDTSRGSVTGWLTTIVRTRALDLLRTRGRRARMTENAAADTDAPAGMGEGFPQPDRGVVEGERARAVAAALGTLPDAQRHAIELAFFEGLTHHETAERLHEPLGTVKTRIRLGMLKLRDLLGSIAPEGAE